MKEHENQIVFSNNNSQFSNWKNTDEKKNTKFCSLIKAEGEFSDLKQYSEFLGLDPNMPKLSCHLDLPRKMFQSEIQRLFPAEKEDTPREFAFHIDLTVLVFENESKQYQTFVKGVFESGYYPVCLNLRDLVQSNIQIFRECLLAEKKPKGKTKNEKKHVVSKPKAENTKAQEEAQIKKDFSVKLIQTMLRIKKTQISEEKLTNLSSAYESGKSRITTATATIHEGSIENRQSNSAERLRLRDYAKRVDEIEEDEFCQHFMDIIFKRLGRDEDLTEVFMESLDQMLIYHIDGPFLKENEYILSKISPDTSDKPRRDPDPQKVMRRNQKQTKKTLEPEKEANDTEISQLAPARASFNANQGIVLVLKSAPQSKLFFETMDECILKSSPFETRKCSQALRLFKEFREYLPSYFNQMKLYKQIFRDSSFFDFVIRKPQHAAPGSQEKKENSDLEDYFASKGFLNSDLGVSSLYSYSQFLTSRTRIVENSKNEKVKKSVKKGGKAELKKKGSEEDPETPDFEFEIKSGFEDFLDFLKWSRKHQISFLSQLENKAILSKMSSIPFSNLEINVPRPKKKKRNTFDISDYKGSSFFYLYKALIEHRFKHQSEFDLLSGHINELVSQTLQEEHNLISLWNDSKQIRDLAEFFNSEFNKSLSDFGREHNQEGDQDVFLKLMTRNLFAVDKDMWKVVCTKQEKALDMKFGFFQKGLFERMSRSVLESFRNVCVLELNRLVYLFKGLAKFYRKPQLYPINQSLNLFAKNFFEFLKEGKGIPNPPSTKNIIELFNTKTESLQTHLENDSKLKAESFQPTTSPENTNKSVHISHISNDNPIDPIHPAATFETLQHIKQFLSISSNQEFDRKPDPSIFELSHFPDFFKDFSIGDDICQNFTFLKLFQISHKMTKFCDDNMSRLDTDSQTDAGLVQTLRENLRLSKLKIQRLLRFTISKVIRALSIYTGFFKLYDKFIFKAVEAMNKLICEWYSDCLKTVSKFQFLENKFFSIFNFKFNERIEEKVGKLTNLTPDFEIFPTKIIFNDFELNYREIDLILNFDDLGKNTPQTQRKRVSILKRGISKLVTPEMIKNQKQNFSPSDQNELQKVLTKLSQSVINHEDNTQTFALTKRETTRLDQPPRLNFFRHCLLISLMKQNFEFGISTSEDVQSFFLDIRNMFQNKFNVNKLVQSKPKDDHLEFEVDLEIVYPEIIDILINCQNPKVMRYFKDDGGRIDLTELLICIILKDWLLLPSRDIFVLKSFIPNGNQAAQSKWLETLTSLEYQDEQMHHSIKPNDLNRVFYLKKLLFYTADIFSSKSRSVEMLVNSLYSLYEKSKASPKITKYFDFLKL